MKRLARIDFAASPPDAGLSLPVLLCGLCAMALAMLLQGSTRGPDDPPAPSGGPDAYGARQGIGAVPRTVPAPPRQRNAAPRALSRDTLHAQDREAPWPRESERISARPS